tara:strand:- start:568 stop:1023 length:456 start_codon:yes stop_codon:yes gene_type:complete
MNLTSNNAITIAFSFLIIIQVYFYMADILHTSLDYFVSILAILISLLLLLFDNNKLFDVAHFLYCVLYLFVVTLFSQNLYLLTLNAIMLVVIIASRVYYQNCILNIKQNNQGFFVNLNDTVKKYLLFWDWDYIFPVLLFITTVKLTKLGDF